MNKILGKLKSLGPGVITGGADDDPAGIVTYTIVGATTGFSLLWLIVLATPMMIAVQSMASRISIVTGESLAQIITLRFSKRITIFVITLLALANIITIGADLNGVATVLGILTGIKPVYALILVTTVIAYGVMFNAYSVIKKGLMALVFVLFVYVIAAMIVHPDVKTVLFNTFIPRISFSSAYVIAALGLLGTTISPYMLFWQAAEEREEKRTILQAEAADFDTLTGMLYSNGVAYFIIVASAAMLYGSHIPINTMQDAALALKPLGGEYTFLLFTTGVLAAGFLAIPVLAGSTAYAIADTFGWREGMDYKFGEAKGFYLVFLGSLLIGDLIYLSPISTVEALYYSQVLDGVLLPALVTILLVIGNSKKVMGAYTNSLFNNIFGVVTFLVSIVLTCIMFYGLVGA